MEIFDEYGLRFNIEENSLDDALILSQRWPREAKTKADLHSNSLCSMYVMS
jgi:hypothetical protein